MTSKIIYSQYTIFQDASLWQKIINQSILSLLPPQTLELAERKVPLKKERKKKLWGSYFINKTIKVRILLPTYSAKSSITLLKAETDMLPIMAEFHSLLCSIISHRCAKESSIFEMGCTQKITTQHRTYIYVAWFSLFKAFNSR